MIGRVAYVGMVFALVVSTAARSEGWTPVDTGTTSTLTDLFFHDATAGVAVGADGTVLLTGDGGETWAGPAQAPPEAPDLYGVDFGDADHGVAVGLQGTVWWTDDAGRHWTAGTSGTAQNLFEVALFDASNGLSVGWGGTILRTTNGGADWTPMPSGSDEPLWGVCVLDDDTAIVVGDYTILRTADRGDTWSAIDHPMSNAWLYDVAFADSLHGLAVGDFATILRTRDGGLTWTVDSNSTDDAEWFMAVATRNPTQAMAVGWFDGGQHNAVRTDDGGSNWTVEATGYARSLRSIVDRPGLTIATGLGGLVLKAPSSVAVPPSSSRPFELLQNRPNPFNPRTRIPFVLAEPARVSLIVYDLSGRVVRTLLDEPMDAGASGSTWDGLDEDGRPVASGVYLYELRVGRQRAWKKASVLR